MVFLVWPLGHFDRSGSGPLLVLACVTGGRRRERVVEAPVADRLLICFAPFAWRKLIPGQLAENEGVA